MFTSPMFTSPMLTNPMFTNPMFTNPIVTAPLHKHPADMSPEALYSEILKALDFTKLHHRCAESLQRQRLYTNAADSDKVGQSKAMGTSTWLAMWPQRVANINFSVVLSIQSR